MMYDTLIYNGRLLTMAKGLAVVETGGVLIKDGVIEDAGEEDGFVGLPVAERINARGAIIMPGLVNGHTHVPMSMFRGLADDLPLDQWLNDHIFPAEAEHVNPGSVEKWSFHSAVEMLLGGTTTCCDGYFFENHTAMGLVRAGIRGVAGQGILDFPAPGVPDPEQNIFHAVDMVEKIKGMAGLVTPSIFCHSPYTCSGDTLVRAKQAALDEGVLFQIHAAETRDEIQKIGGAGKGRSVIQYLDGLGILDKTTLLAHGVWVDETDIEIIAERGSGLVHCPESNMKLASGIAPIPDLIRAGVAVGLGTDGCASNNDHDLFSEMDTAAKLHKVARMDPCVMDARTVVKMATREGARAIGMGEIIGTLEKGKQADIILVETSAAHMVPMNDPYSSLVYSAKSSDVSLVMVGGKIRVKEKKRV